VIRYEMAGVGRTGSIQIENWIPLFRDTLQAFLNLIVTRIGLLIRGCSLHEKDGQRRVALLTKEYFKDGEKTYSRIVEFSSKSNYGAFQREALEAVDAYRGGHNPQQTWAPVQECAK
jgi:hypothetical protein